MLETLIRIFFKYSTLIFHNVPCRILQTWQINLLRSRICVGSKWRVSGKPPGEESRASENHLPQSPQESLLVESPERHLPQSPLRVTSNRLSRESHPSTRPNLVAATFHSLGAPGHSPALPYIEAAGSETNRNEVVSGKRYGGRERGLSGGGCSRSIWGEGCPWWAGWGQRAVAIGISEERSIQPRTVYTYSTWLLRVRTNSAGGGLARCREVYGQV